MKKRIFVFESNLAGRHIKGSALTAYKAHGAEYGQSVGLQGNSYAIPTKDENFKSLSLPKIRRHVEQFIRFAKLNPEMTFEISRIGCSFPGYEDVDIAPMFSEAPTNCVLPAGWRNLKPQTA